MVISTFPDSSADHAGIKPHDSILKVDGYPVIDENFNRLRGPACSALVVTVQSPGEAPRDIVLVRHAMTGNLRIDARLVPTSGWVEGRLHLHPHIFRRDHPGPDPTGAGGLRPAGRPDPGPAHERRRQQHRRQPDPVLLHPRQARPVRQPRRIQAAAGQGPIPSTTRRPFPWW